MTNNEKVNKQFERAVKQASKCRHKKYQVSCFSCPEYKSCDIQNRIDKLLKAKRL